jgi:hypothetical protein
MSIRITCISKAAGDQSESILINFNYTDTINNRLRFLNNGNSIGHDTLQYIKPHGTLETDIALGVNDKFLRNGGLAYSFLKKSYSKNYNLNRWTKIYKRASKIFIFGHSLGITDSDIFYPMFKYYLEDKSMDRKIKIFDIYGSDDKI